MQSLLPPLGSVRVIALGTTLVALPRVAAAGSCVGTTIDSKACDTDGANGSTANDVCQTSDIIVTCYLDRLGGVFGATMHVSLQGPNLEIHGRDGNGNEFCCIQPVPTQGWRLNVETTPGDPHAHPIHLPNPDRIEGECGGSTDSLSIGNPAKPAADH